MWDIAPTLLHLMGEAIPLHMDGAQLFDLGKEPTYTAAELQEASEYSFEDEEEELLKKRLEKLGYL